MAVAKRRRDLRLAGAPSGLVGDMGRGIDRDLKRSSRVDMRDPAQNVVVVGQVVLPCDHPAVVERHRAGGRALAPGEV
jgi:hypothetical protein